MKKYLVWFLLFAGFLIVRPQKYGHEWVRYQQSYFKFPVYKEGIYRIDSSVLSQKFNLQFANPQRFQLFLNGKEIPIYIHGEGDGKINTGDYIEFYASPLRPDFDSLIYYQPRWVPNPYKPLFYDTIYAFLSLNPNSTNNLRYQLQTDTTLALYPLTAYAYSLALHNPVTQFNYGIKSFDGSSSDPRFTNEEGFGVFLSKGAQVNTNFSGLAVYSSSLPVRFQVRYCGASQAGPHFDHRAQVTYTNHVNNSVLLYDTLYNGYALVRKVISFPSHQLGNNSNFSFISAHHSSFTFNNSTFMFFMELFYPKQTNLQNALFAKYYVDDHGSASKQSFIFSNANAGTTGSIVAYDIRNHNKLVVHYAGGNARMVIPNTGNQKIIVIQPESNFIPVTRLLDVNGGLPFTYFKQNLNGKKPYVIIYHPKMLNGSIAYKNYRQSVAGGSWYVVFANILELEEQFGHGIPKNPLMIKNFLKYLYDSLSQRPEYCFMIGKSIMQFDLYNTPWAYGKCLIPTFGYPASDMQLSAGIDPTNTVGITPDIPIGRLASQSDNDVMMYLSKVQQHEQTQNARWKKEVLHFVGGDNISLSNALTLFMSTYRNIIQDTLFGAHVTTFKKITSAPVQVSMSDSVKWLIEKGVSMLTFFGHGSAFGFDQAIDNPDLYNNAGKYYFVFSLSCFAGDIHKPYNYLSVGENFLFRQQRGAIAYLSNTGIGYVNALYTFGERFYRAMGYYEYAAGLGDMIQWATRQCESFSDQTVIFNAASQTLHGDPAVKIGPNKWPDYEITASDFKVVQNLNTDSLELRIRYRNLGKAIQDSFFIRVVRTFPNNDSAVYFKKVKAPFYFDSIWFRVPMEVVKGVGLNKFRVKIDDINQIIESNEGNNMIGNTDVMVMGGDIYPVYPYPYAVVPAADSIVLKASTTDPFAPLRRYVFQLDTTDTFLNPVYQTTVSSTGGVVEVKVPVPYGDSTVYFWRVSRDSVLPTDKYVWKERSFQEISNRYGWSQYHFFQFKRNTFQYVKMDRPNRKFVFQNSNHKIYVENMLYPFYWPLNIRFFFNNILMEDWSCSPDGWNFAVFDSITGEPRKVVSLNYPASGAGQYNNCICEPNQIFYVYSFSRNQSIGAGSEPCGDNPNWKTDIINFLNNGVQNGEYVLAYTVGKIYHDYAQISQYDNALYSAFESIGAVNIRNITDTVPYILFGKKGMVAGQGHEVVGAHQRSQIILLDSIQTKLRQGYIASEIIGPSYRWKSLHWQLKPYDPTPGDTTILKVVGIKPNGQKDTLAVFPKDSTDVLALYNYVNAQQYPYIQLVAFKKDQINLTSPQLRKWMVLYDQAPECAINPKKGFKALNDTLMEGDKAAFILPVENIGTEMFKDSLLITYGLEDQTGTWHSLPYKLKKKNFSPGEVLKDTIKINSIHYPGTNALWVYVNKPGHPKYQYEQEFFNNIARLPFRVNRDITNPILDVTFDGVHIMNRDIVSPQPQILISLKDENLFLALNDTSDFHIFLKHPGQGTYTPVYFLNQLKFYPAQLPDNSCRIEFKPTFTVEGIYELRVQGKDRSGNYSGNLEYRVQFEVILKSMITHVMNYPNPFSTSTRFVFTLTGSKIPDVFTIQIMTVSGKVVREITRDELGPIRIGRNITQYAWDGRDQFGDRLANGVYLYRVITRMNDESPEHLSTSADRFFKEGFGKMVLMR